MAYTISFTVNIDGELTDPSEIYLADSAAGYGVREADSLALVIAAGTPLVRNSVGNYSFEVTNLTPGTRYEYAVRFVHNGVANYFNDDFYEVGPLETIDAGRYATFDGIVAKFGEVSLRKWAALNEATAEDPELYKNVITDAILRTDEFIDSFLLNGPYVIPFTTDPGIPYVIHDIANTLAGIHVYEAQGVVDFNPTSNQPEHRFSRQRQQAMRDLGKIKTGRMRLFTPDVPPVPLDHSVSHPSIGE